MRKILYVDEYVGRIIIRPNILLILVLMEDALRVGYLRVDQ